MSHEYSCYLIERALPHDYGCYLIAGCQQRCMGPLCIWVFWGWRSLYPFCRNRLRTNLSSDIGPGSSSHPAWTTNDALSILLCSHHTAAAECSSWVIFGTGAPLVCHKQQANRFTSSRPVSRPPTACVSSCTHTEFEILLRFVVPARGT